MIPEGMELIVRYLDSPFVLTRYENGIIFFDYAPKERDEA